MFEVVPTLGTLLCHKVKQKVCREIWAFWCENREREFIYLMVVEDAIQLKNQRIGGKQFDWLESEGQFKASTIDYITTARERSAETLQSTEASLMSSLGVLRGGHGP